MSLDIETPDGGWDSMVATMPEDRLLLQEAAHRVANELAAALAALRLINPSNGSRLRWRLLASAIDRLEGFAAVNRVLALPTATPVALSREMERLCEGLGAARRGVAGSGMRLDLGDLVVDGATARRVLLVAAELVQNAILHALEGRSGTLRILLRLEEDAVLLGVVDDGPGIAASAATRGNGMGSVIVSELVRRSGGVMECSTGPDGTAFHVAIPHGTEIVGADGDE